MKPVLLITGAAHGLGRALAFGAARDYRLALFDRDRVAGEHLADELRRDGAEVLFLHGDVAVDADWRHALERVQRRWERLDILINNAGVAAMGPFEGQTPDTWERLWRTNVLGAVNGCRTALTLMKRQGDGHLINVAALAGITAPPGMAAYVACNAALIRFTEALAAELDGLNINVTVVCPDLFSSEMSRRMPNADPLSRARLQRAMDDAPESAVEVADTILQQIGKRPLYLFPQPEARRDWRRKRWRPERFVARMARLGSSLRRYR